MTPVSDYKAIWQLAIPHLKQGRFYDLMHTADVVGFMLRILLGEGKQDLAPVQIPAIILHDIGWSKVGREKHRQWDQTQLRAEHMREGAILADSILRTITYEPELREEIVQLVATHDNVYLGQPPASESEKILRDADACYILTHDSFWKDYHVKGNNMSQSDFLELQCDKARLRFTKTAQQITDEEIRQRHKEVTEATPGPSERFRLIEEKAAAVRDNPPSPDFSALG